MTRDFYDRSATGNVDQVEVVVLGDWKRRGLTFPCSDSQAEEIVRLWRALPEAMQARCHIPAYGLRFHAGQNQLLEASLCWQCNNIWLRAGGQDFYSTFDSADADAQRLLDLLTEIAGPAGAGQELER